MRKDIVAVGIILCFVGLIFVSSSQVVVRSPRQEGWVNVAGSGRQKPTNEMSLQGNLTQGDTFRVYFTKWQDPGPIREEAGVMINLTDKNGYLIYSFYNLITEPFPRLTANYTGVYKVNAQSFFVGMTSLALQKREITEPESQYPYRSFLPVGAVILAGGSGSLLLGAKLSKRRRRIHKRK